MKIKVTGLILAGGKSSRMGQDKGTMTYYGQSMVEYGINALKSNCHELVISTNLAHYEKYALKMVKDSYPEHGPMGGIYDGLRVAANDWVLVTTCDMPYVDQKVFKSIIEHLPEEGNCLVTTFKGRLQPLLGCYHKSLLPALKQHLERKALKMMTFIKQCETTYLDLDEFADQSPDLFRNINSPSDL